MLKVNQSVKLQFNLDFLYLLSVRLKDIIHVMPAIEVPGIVGKFMAA